MSVEQRQRTIGMMVALAASLVAGTEASGTISGVSEVAGSLTLALSFYAFLIFFLHIAHDLMLLRPPVVRLWHAAVLACMTAAATWIVSLPHVAHWIQRLAVFGPLCVLVTLIAGPWHGLLPDFPHKPKAQVLEQEERSRENE